MISYRIYGNNRKFGWELLNTVYREDKVYDFINYVNPNEYMTIMVVKHIFEYNQDISFLHQHLEEDKPLIRNRKK